ncbi:hypothetical protein B296_00058769, partial [Ensete ventricosum]
SCESDRSGILPKSQALEEAVAIGTFRFFIPDLLFFMGTKTVEELLDNSAGVHFSGLHVDDLDLRNSKELPATSAIENGYREPFVIG